MHKTVLLAVALALFGCAVPVDNVELARFAVASEPDPVLTPGALCTRADRDYDGDRYAEEIAHCKRDVSKRTKIKVAAAYGVSEDELPDYQIDHYYPLALGGSNDTHNLWPLIFADARRKAKLEESLYLSLRDGDITQAQALDAIHHWRELTD